MVERAQGPIPITHDIDSAGVRGLAAAAAAILGYRIVLDPPEAASAAVPGDGGRGASWRSGAVPTAGGEPAA